MRVMIEGQSHEFHGEPSPAEIHRLYQPDLPIPIMIEEYPGELGDIYRANGRATSVGILCLPWLSVRTALQIIGSRPAEQLNRGALLGPYMLSGHSMGCNPEGLTGIGIWLPPKIGIGL